MAAQKKTIGGYVSRHGSRETAPTPDVEYVGRHRSAEADPPAGAGR